MAQAAPTKSKINTNPTQLARGRTAQRAAGGARSPVADAARLG